jgi:hypothetical protein
MYRERASPVPKAFGMRAEAYFCLVPPCGIVSFSAMEKERREKWLSLHYNTWLPTKFYRLRGTSHINLTFFTLSF